MDRRQKRVQRVKERKGKVRDWTAKQILDTPFSFRRKKDYNKAIELMLKIGSPKFRREFYEKQGHKEPILDENTSTGRFYELTGKITYPVYSHRIKIIMIKEKAKNEKRDLYPYEKEIIKDLEKWEKRDRDEDIAHEKAHKKDFILFGPDLRLSSTNNINRLKRAKKEALHEISANLQVPAYAESLPENKNNWSQAILKETANIYKIEKPRDIEKLKKHIENQIDLVCNMIQNKQSTYEIRKKLLGSKFS